MFSGWPPQGPQNMRVADCGKGCFALLIFVFVFLLLLVCCSVLRSAQRSTSQHKVTRRIFSRVRQRLTVIESTSAPSHRASSEHAKSKLTAALHGDVKRKELTNRVVASTAAGAGAARWTACTRITVLVHHSDTAWFVDAVLCTVPWNAHIVAQAVEAREIKAAVSVGANIMHAAQVHLALEHDTLLIRLARLHRPPTLRSRWRHLRFLWIRSGIRFA
jgi:hypothetical protein